MAKDRYKQNLNGMEAVTVGMPTNENEMDFEHQFFDGAETVDIVIKVLKETYEDILAAIQRNGWELEEGLRIILTLGLGYTQGQRLLQADNEERNRLIERLMDLESVAAVMKFRAFSFMRDNQVLDMQTGALRNTILGLETLVQQLREENAALRQELRRLKSAENASPATTTLQEPASPESVTASEPEDAPLSQQNRAFD
jgi:cell division septum initiation protein DivIVA